MKKILIITLLFFVMLICGLFATYKIAMHYYEKPIASLKEQIIVINKGDSVSKISSYLGLDSKSSFMLSHLSKLDNKSVNIKTGEFLIPEKSSIESILKIITSNNTVDYKITIVEGYQKYQVRDIFNGIDNVVGDSPDVKQEGVFLPDTYLYKSGDSKQSILNRAKKAMQDYLDNAWNNRDKKIPIKNKKEALILASVIEKETSKANEYKIVSSVFMNCLKRKMKLQADSTAIYGITQGNKKFNRKLYKGDLKKENLYNTYYVKRLPVAPICNPSKKAIDAVMHPANTKYLYFVADGTGGHVFSKTSKEHERNVLRWRKIKKKMLTK